MLETRLFIYVRIGAVGFTINEILIWQVVLNFECVLQIASAPLPLTLVLEWQRKVVVIFLAAFQIILLSLTDEWVLSILLLDLRTHWLPYRTVIFWQCTLRFVWWLLCWIFVEVRLVTQRRVIDSFSHFGHEIRLLCVQIANSSLIFCGYLMRKWVVANQWLINSWVLSRTLLALICQWNCLLLTVFRLSVLRVPEKRWIWKVLPSNTYLVDTDAET